jgi:hypothetical protein
VISHPGADIRAVEKARHREAVEIVVKYHEEQLLKLLEHVREGFRKLDTGEIDAFELDELIHRYKRSTKELWKFCQITGSDAERSARTLAWLRENEDEPDWWEAGEYKRHRRDAESAVGE